MTAASHPQGPKSKQAVRLRRFLMAAMAYGVCIPLLLFANWLGFLPLRAVSVAIGLMVAVNASVYFLFRTNLNERFRKA